MVRRSFAAAVLAVSVCAGAQAAEPTDVTLVQMHPVVGIGEEVFLFAVPEQLGYFKKEGLNVTLQQSSSGGAAVQLLQSGSAQFATTMPESILQVDEQGGDVIAVDNIKRNNGSVLVVLSDSPIKGLDQLKGKTIGGPSFSSGAGLALRDNLRQMGMTDSDYSTVLTGAGAAAIAALKNHSIDGVLMWDAMLGAAENSGLDLRTITIPAQNRMGGMVLATRGSYAAEHPGVVAGMCRATAEGRRFTMDNPEAAIKLFWKQFPSTKPVTLDDATAMHNALHIMELWFHFANDGLPKGEAPGQFIAANWQYSADAYRATGMLKGTMPVDKGYTTRFLTQCQDYDTSAVDAAAKSFK